MNKLVRYAAPVVILAAGFGGYSFLHWAKPEPEKKTEAPRPMSVFVETVRKTDATLEVRTEGEVRAATAVEIVSQIPGRVVSVSDEFVEGGRVEPGVSLVEIEPVDYQLALSQAQARVAEAEVSLQTAIAVADVARKQLRDAANASDLALKKPQVAEARARLEAAQADLRQAELNLSRTSIALPFTGRLVSTSVDVGQYVSPGVSLGKAFATDRVEVRLALTDNHLASLNLPIGFVAEPGEGLDVTFSAQVAGREHLWFGKLVRLDASIDPATRMLYGVAELERPYDQNRSEFGMPMAVGLYVSAEIQGNDVESVAVIPRDALRAGNKVYVVNQDGKLEIRDVIVRHSSPQRAVIAAGLENEDRVVVSSIRNAIPGMALNAMEYSVDQSSIAGRQQTEPTGS
ncbi:MAG: efflux RND transporter periplasmic adaptor subunit [Pseudomonadales bacterium]|nr:efflux RND transporter periplasmic adaptor subunit [Pseudomonadales bacterium]